MSDIFSANNEGCQIAELDEIAMILMGISDNMFSGPSVSISDRGTYFYRGNQLLHLKIQLKVLIFAVIGDILQMRLH